MLPRRLEHERNRLRKYVAGLPLPDRHDPARVVREDLENVLLEAGHTRAIALLRAAGRGPTSYII
jgi:hypothetical protein